MHPIHKHMHSHITKQNVKAAIKDDKAHMTYLKEDVNKDQKAGGKFKDINQTADEKHISKLAGDVKDDERKEHGSPAHHGSHRIPVVKDGTSHRHGAGGSTTVSKGDNEINKKRFRNSSPANAVEDVIQKDATESDAGGFGTGTEDKGAVIDFEKTLGPINMTKKEAKRTARKGAKAGMAIPKK